MKQYPPMVGTTAAPSWAGWHEGPLCEVSLMMGPTQLFISCATCRIAVNLEAIAFRADPGESRTPREDLPDDTSDSGSRGE